jgi:hypothetical protein
MHRYEVVSDGYKTDCWEWLLARNKHGYGLCRDKHGRMRGAHCVYYEEAKGAITPGLQIDHLCGVRSCVNPDHLEPVTAAENIRRGAGTKLTPSAVAEIRASCEPQKVLAERYGVHQSHISRIKNRQTWR